MSERPDAPDPVSRTPNLRSQVALLLAFATLPVGVLAVAQGFNTYNDITTLRRDALAAEATRMSDRERGTIREAFGALTALKGQIDLDAAPDGCSDRMKTYVARTDSVSFAGVASGDGVIRCGYPLPKPLDLKGTPEYEAFVAAPRRTVTVYRKGAVTGAPVIVASEPIHRDGALAGSIAVSLSSAYLDWASAPERAHSAHFAIVDGAGREAAGFGAVDWLPESAALGRLLRSGDRTVVLPTAGGGKDRIYAVTPLFENDIFSVSSWPDDSALEDVTWAQYLTLLLPLVMWGLAVIVAYYAVDRFALRHVVYLDRLVSVYARSGRSLRAKGVRDAPLEFAKLGGSFDRMAQEIEDREDAMRDSIAEKDTLLKEVYHRVKNNLQLIVSLTNLQLREATNEHERDSLMRLQERVHGLGAVHQRLSEAEQVNAVRIDSLLEDIASNAKSARETCMDAVTLTFDTVPHVEGPDRALPIALFATEAIANAFVHALENRASGWMHLSLHPRAGEEGEMVLEIANSCPPDAPAPEEAQAGLGSRLIEGFTTQLRGRTEREVSPDRYTLRLVFPVVERKGA